MAKRIKRLTESWLYIPRADRDLAPELQSAFRLRPMAQAERTVARDDVARTVIQEDGSQMIVGRERQVAVSICVNHIVDAQNFPAGAPDPWPVERSARLAYLESMDDELVREIGNEVFTRSTIGEPEKNSSPPEPT